MQLRAIAADEGAGPARAITLTRPLRDTAALAGATVILRLSCDKTIAGCARWGNALNFGGHPQMGPQNLSIPTRETNAAGGKK
ncbi:MAG: phage BR0599 family protein [Opitutaceae bacterium]|nr:phage BR0599 family protein [Opitutaceae bacterium]